MQYTSFQLERITAFPLCPKSKVLSMICQKEVKLLHSGSECDKITKELSAKISIAGAYTVKTILT